MQFAPPTHVIFDLDGTLLDTEELYTQAAQSVVGRYGKVYDWHIKRQVIGGDPRVGARLVVEQLKLPIAPEEYLHEREKLMRELCKDVAAMPGAAQLVEVLHRRGIPLGIATSSSRELAELKLAAQPFAARFAALACSDDPGVKQAKPEPDVFLLAAERLHADPKTCLVFEDTPKGVSAARAAGMQVIAVPDRRVLRHELAHAHLILGSLEQVTLKALAL
jgi:pseudouridine-5'-monophosphatase